MSFTLSELKRLRVDLAKWINSVDRHLAADGSAGEVPQATLGPSEVVMELTLLIQPREAAMLLRLAGAIDGLPAGDDRARMRAVLRYCWQLVYSQAFGDAPSLAPSAKALLEAP